MQRIRRSTGTTMINATKNAGAVANELESPPVVELVEFNPQTMLVCHSNVQKSAETSL